MFITNTVFGGRGFSVGGSQGYLKYASGYPLTLTKTLAKPPESVTVYGAEGGVGDKTINLLQIGGDSGIRLYGFSAVGIETDSSQRRKSNDYGTSINSTSPSNAVVITQSQGVDSIAYNNGYVNIGITGLDIDTNYTLSCNIEISDESLTNPSALDFQVGGSGSWRNISIANGKGYFPVRFSPTSKQDVEIRLHGASLTLSDFILVEGSYTAKTMPPYEPYGYKIPLLLSDGTANKTINLYSDSALGEGDYLTVNPKTKTATRGENTGTDTWTTTDVSALQNWSQDWKIPKSEELTVTAGTKVLPSNMDMAYMSKTETDIDKLLRTVRKGNMSKYAIGSELIFPWTDKSPTTPVPYNAEHIVAHHGYTEVDNYGREFNGLFLQWHYATPYDMPFNVREALYTAPAGGLSAGTYYFKVVGLRTDWDSYISGKNEGKTFMFTLTDDLPEGACILLSAAYSTSKWEGTNVYVRDNAYAPMRNHDIGDDGYMPLSLWDGESGSPLSGDASNYKTDGTSDMINHIRRALLGDARWSQSALRQWLNSAAPARIHEDAENYPGWWEPQKKYDMIPSRAVTYENIYADPVTTNTGKAGFLSGYSEEFITAMRPVQVRSIYYTGATFGTAASDITYDKVFLPSLTEMYIVPENATHDGGVAWDFYKQLNAASGRTAKYAKYSTYAELISKPINAKTGSAVTVWLRSAVSYNGCLAWCIGASGYVNRYGAAYAYRQRPACCIG